MQSTPYYFSLNILDTNLVINTMVQFIPTLEPGYPVENIDERSPSVVTRVQGDGSEAAPLIVDFDLGSVERVEMAAFLSSVKAYGSVILRGSADTYPPGAWDWTESLVSYHNLLVNGGGERGLYSLAQPAFGTSDVDHVTTITDAIIPGNTCFVAKLAFSEPVVWNSNEIVGPPRDKLRPDGYTSRYFSRIQADVAGYITSTGAFMLSPVREPQVGETYRMDGLFRLPSLPSGNIQIMLLSMDGSFAVAESVSFALATVDADGEWHRFSADLLITVPGSRYVAISVSFGLAQAGLWVDVDDLCIQRVEVDGYVPVSYEEILEDTGAHFAVLPVGKRVARSLRLEIVNDIDGTGYVDIGRIMIGRGLSFPVAPPLSYTGDLGRVIDVTSSGVPYLASRTSRRRTFEFQTQLFQQGEGEELRKTVEDSIEDQVFVSLYGETRKTRAVLGAFAGEVSLQESPLPNFVEARFRMLEER